MKFSFVSRSFAIVGAAALLASPLFAQDSTPLNPIKLFGPVNVTSSQVNASYESPVNFNSSLLNLSCPASPVAVLSSQPISASASSYPASDNLLVDNNINVSVNNGTATDVCAGGVDSNPLQNCFTPYYESSASNSLYGMDPDNFVTTGGVPAIDISNQLVSGATQQVSIVLQDEGGEVANSTIYLNTNCSLAGVSGTSTITGNAISTSNPNTVNQSFTFNPVNNQQVTFAYNLDTASNTLTSNQSGTTPIVSDQGLTQAQYATLVSDSPFATSSCIVHSGELINNVPVCKEYTLQCYSANPAQGVPNLSGANCPVSSEANEQFQDVFDGPVDFTLGTVSSPTGTWNLGIGFLMASDNWTSSPCDFFGYSGTCPQNLLTSFTGPGLARTLGQTTHPNSTFISVSGVPEPLTTVTVTNSAGTAIPLSAGNWTNNPNPYITLSSQPPNLTGSSVPNAANFVAAPINTITFGVTEGTTPPAVGTTSATDTVLTNPAGCPASYTATAPAFPTTPQPVALADLVSLPTPPDGQYLVHYYATDCAGTKELNFYKVAGSWTTNYYTYGINIDTTKPAISNVTLSPSSGPYTQGQLVQATVTCQDSGSGLASCAGQPVTPAGTTTAVQETVTLPTGTPGSALTYNITATDVAGNTSTQTINYAVNAAYDNQVKLTVYSGTVTYPGGTNLVAAVTSTTGHTPTGSVAITANGKVVTTINLGGGGAAYYYISGLSAGPQTLQADYSGDTYNPAGNSAPVILNVNPVPVNLSASCWNTPYSYGANFTCTANASSNAGSAQGNLTYQYDSNAPVNLPLSNGSALFNIPTPPAGNHTVRISYAAQTNYAASNVVTKPFVVTAAPVQVQLSPSSWYITSGSLMLQATVSSWSAGPPNSGTVTFTYGGLSQTVSVNASGVATLVIPPGTLKDGGYNFTATYNGNSNYGTGSGSAWVTLAY